MPNQNLARELLYPTDPKILVRVVFLYVGQGASAVAFVKDGDAYRVVVVDINLDRKNGGIDVPRLIVDILNGAPLDVFANTHPHDDHLCGTQELSDAIDIKAVWHSNHKPSKKYGSRHGELTALIKKVTNKYGKAAEVIIEGSRSAVTYGEAEYHFLSPAEHVTDDVNEEDADKRRARIHEQCGVIKFGKNTTWIMIVGDADRCAFEKHITKYHKERLPSFALGGSHHGSRTFFKETEEQDPYLDGLNAIDPEYVVLSAPTQDESPHGHPHDDAVELYEDHVGEENVLHTGEERYCYWFDIYTDGTHSETQTDDGQLAEEYGLDDDSDDDDEGDDNGGGGSGGGKRETSKATGPFVITSPREQTGDYAPKKYG
jgi:beta-lactamase superfamily II metal-dependent hydrolase